MLDVIGLRKTYVSDQGRVTEAIAEVTFSVGDGELVSIVGPSGSGKTTMLKCFAGLLAPTAGEIRLNGRAVSSPPPELAVVFQDYSRSLFPWYTVQKNVALPLHGTADIKERVAEGLAAVGLSDFAGHYPWELSGGMQQRVAIARALAYRPRLLLMDEPFASVDAQTRNELEDLVLRVWEATGITIVFVTHDIDEALYMSDRIVLVTQRPSSVKEILEAGFPRPRDQLATRALPGFSELRGRIYRAIAKPADEDIALEDGAVSGLAV